MNLKLPQMNILLLKRISEMLQHMITLWNMHQHITQMWQHMIHLSTNEIYVGQLNKTIFLKSYQQNGHKKNNKSNKNDFSLNVNNTYAFPQN